MNVIIEERTYRLALALALTLSFLLYLSFIKEKVFQNALTFSILS
jgi:hypothetical protein